MKTPPERSEVRRSLATFCRKRRLEVGKTEQEIERFSEPYGKDFYISHSTVSRIETQGLFPSLPKLLTLARFYDVSITDFFRVIGARESELHEVTRMEVDETGEDTAALFAALEYHATRTQAILKRLRGRIG